MSRKTKEELEIDLANETRRANGAVIDLAKLKGGLKALVDLVEDGSISDLDAATDVVYELIDSDQPQIISSGVIEIGQREFLPGEQ